MAFECRTALLHASWIILKIVIPTTVTTTTGDINIPFEFIYDYDAEIEETLNNKKLSEILNIYNISANGKVTHEYENFFKIELLKVSEKEPLFTKLTTTTTDFEKLTEEIVNEIAEEKIVV